MFLCENLPDGYDKACPMEESLDKYKTFNPKNVIKRAARAKKMRFSEVFDSGRAPPFVLVTTAPQKRLLDGYNLPISSTNLKLLT